MLLKTKCLYSIVRLPKLYAFSDFPKQQKCQIDRKMKNIFDVGDRVHTKSYDCPGRVTQRVEWQEKLKLVGGSSILAGYVYAR